MKKKIERNIKKSKKIMHCIYVLFKYPSCLSLSSILFLWVLTYMFHDMFELSSLVTYLRWFLWEHDLLVQLSKYDSYWHYWNPTKLVLVKIFGLIGIFIIFIPFCFLVWHYTLLMQLPLEIDIVIYIWGRIYMSIAYEFQMIEAWFS